PTSGNTGLTPSNYWSVTTKMSLYLKGPPPLIRGSHWDGSKPRRVNSRWSTKTTFSIPTYWLPPVEKRQMKSSRSEES
ncbi:MAG: hypothetical protein WC683_20550, partial [bacterium]